MVLQEKKNPNPEDLLGLREKPIGCHHRGGRGFEKDGAQLAAVLLLANQLAHVFSNDFGHSVGSSVKSWPQSVSIRTMFLALLIRRSRGLAASTTAPPSYSTAYSTPASTH